MATFFFQEEITKDSVTKLIADIEAHEDQNADIYFCSVGGDTSMSEILIHYFSFCVKDIKLIFNWEIASAAVDVMLYSVCEKELLSDSWGIIHLYSRDVAVRDMLDKESCDKFLDDELALQNAALIQSFTPFLTRSEIRKLKKGGSIFLNHERFVKFFEEYAVKVVQTEEKEEANGEDLSS